MVKRLTNSIVDILKREHLIQPDQAEFYRYGSELLLMSVINVVSVLIVGALSQKLILAITYVVIFAFVRTETGGFHASTYARCFTYYMCIFLLLMYAEGLCLTYGLSRIWFTVIGTMLIVSELAWAPVTMKRYLNEAELRQAKRRSIRKTAICIGILFLSYDNYPVLSYDIFLVLGAVMFLLLLGKFTQQKSK